MKKLLLALVFITATAQAQSVNICTNSSGNSRQPDCSATGALEVTAGTGAADLGKAEDAAHTSGDTGVEILGVYKAAGTVMCSDGDYCPATMSGKGALNVNVWSASAESLSDGTNILKAEDTAEVAGGAGILPYLVRRDTLASSATSSGDHATFNSNANGALWADPVGSTARVCVSVTPDTNAYQANDIVGGELTFANAVRAVMLSGYITAVTITNTEVDGISFDFCPTISSIAATSTTADQGALAVVAADQSKRLPCISVATGDALAASEMYSAVGVNEEIKLAATSLYGVVRTKGAPTWAAAQALQVCVTIAQD